MDELLAAVQEKTGLPAEQAKGAAEAVLNFLKEKLPAGMGEQIESYLEGNTDQAADLAADMVDRAKGLFGGD